jgi:hypothetical protein
MYRSLVIGDQVTPNRLGDNIKFYLRSKNLIFGAEAGFCGGNVLRYIIPTSKILPYDGKSILIFHNDFTYYN